MSHQIKTIVIPAGLAELAGYVIHETCSYESCNIQLFWNDAGGLDDGEAFRAGCSTCDTCTYMCETHKPMFECEACEKSLEEEPTPEGPPMGRQRAPKRSRKELEDDLAYAYQRIAELESAYVE